eukprot:343659_1
MSCILRLICLFCAFLHPLFWLQSSFHTINATITRTHNIIFGLYYGVGFPLYAACWHLNTAQYPLFVVLTANTTHLSLIFNHTVCIDILNWLKCTLYQLKQITFHHIAFVIQ